MNKISNQISDYRRLTLELKSYLREVIKDAMNRNIPEGIVFDMRKAVVVNASAISLSPAEGFTESDKTALNSMINASKNKTGYLIVFQGETHKHVLGMPSSDKGGTLPVSSLVVGHIPLQADTTEPDEEENEVPTPVWDKRVFLLGITPDNIDQLLAETKVAEGQLKEAVTTAVSTLKESETVEVK